MSISPSLNYLEIQRLEKNFGQFQALKDISLTIKQGEFICFLGPSGCGKTTLLRAIAGLELPTSGKVIQNGHDVTFLPPQKRDFGIVFQSYALFPNLTVAENIALGLRNQGMKRKQVDEKVSYWLKLVGLDNQSIKYPAQISGGQQQRVALARALALEPGLLLMDEPLSALDAQVRTHLRTEIKNLQRQLNITTIMVTHDQEEALTMADRIVVMDHGVIKQVGTPSEIYTSPQGKFVASFIGNMNFLDALVVGQNQIRVNRLTLNHNTDTYAPGSKVKLALRPESIEVMHRTTGAVNALVTHVEFMGSFLRILCEADTYYGAQPLMVQIPVNRGVEINLHAGQSVSLRWAKHDMQLFSAGDSHVQ
ncbi:putative 2-aminoethylphosphonate ABC transporter ATP-binding protein [Budvicia aquatica]|uniref:putative 2-aminoethylphosphonate ABC transporter ATP-binding protein n=1 Tax=Budvicia aquatica TaxID=82979 RepID=UPI002086B7B9|nr:putative 2-aminoethylphosphonate ABC transporter ATP-binding protein [Budvicia aquatica]GKX52982.1 ABC transporter ATP-binding protein [Budvicia aquatica]